MANSGKIYVIIGAKGGLGAEIVKRLAEKPLEEVSEIRCIVRNPSTVPPGLLPTQDERVKVIAGDATKSSTLTMPFKDAEAVFFAAQGKKYKGICKVDRDSCQVVAEVARKQGVERLLLVSSMLTDPRNRLSPTRMILNSPFITGFWGFFHTKGMMDLKFEGENLVRSSGQSYTIVRPGHLIDGELGQAEILAGQTNSLFAEGIKSTRADVAAFCIMAAVNPYAKNATIEIASNLKQKGSQVISPALLEKVVPDHD